MGRFFFALIALVVLLAAIVVLAPQLIPVETYKGRVETAASNALGRNVTVGDDLSFKIWPQPAFHVTELEVANAPGFDAPYLARVAEADIGVKLRPLFNGEVEVTRFVLTEPVINLARAATGEVNWSLGANSAAGDDAGDGGGVKDVRLGDVRFVDGKATYTDLGAGRAYSADDIDLALTLTSLAEPMEAEGTMIFEGAPSKVDIVLTSLRKIMDKEPANLKLDMTLGQSTIGGDLVIETAEGLAYSGPVKLNAPDLPQFAALMGAPLADAPGFDSLAVSGNAAGGADSVRLAGATINFDKIDATGNLALAWAGARPKATGSLAAGTVDLRPYLPPPSEDAAGFPAWSEAPLDLTGLRNIDADIDLTAEKIFLNDLEFGESRMKLAIDNGRMTADIPQLGMYGGGGSGRLVVNARGATPSMTGEFDLASVQAQPFTMDLMNIDKLLGLGGFTFDFSASGSSQAAIMRSLDGSGRFDIADGAIKGINLVKLANAVIDIQQGGLNPTAITAAIAEAQRPSEQTDFSEFLSQFTITDGLVTSPTINLAGPFLTMTGAGIVDLPGQTLDLRLAPKATSTASGEGGRAVAIPVRITGTFSQPKVGIDAEALLRGRAEQSVRDILSGAFGKRGGEEGADAGASENDAAAEEEPATPEDTVRGVLEGVLGGGQRRETAPAEDSGGAEDASADEEAAPQRSPEEEVLDSALGAIFGGSRRQQEEEPEDEPQE